MVIELGDSLAAYKPGEYGVNYSRRLQKGQKITFCLADFFKPKQCLFNSKKVLPAIKITYEGTFYFVKKTDLQRVYNISVKKT